MDPQKEGRFLEHQGPPLTVLTGLTPREPLKCKVLPMNLGLHFLARNKDTVCPLKDFTCK